jgi:hypothetical protein
MQRHGAPKQAENWWFSIYWFLQPCGKSRNKVISSFIVELIAIEAKFQMNQQLRKYILDYFQ